MSGRTLQVTLPDDLEAEISAAVAQGEYASLEEAVIDALEDWTLSRRLLESLDAEELEELMQDVEDEESDETPSKDKKARNNRK